MNNKIISTKLGEIEYATTGKGKPVLFIHGGHTNCNSTLWHKGFDLNKFQLIAPSRFRLHFQDYGWSSSYLQFLHPFSCG